MNCVIKKLKNFFLFSLFCILVSCGNSIFSPTSEPEDDPQGSSQSEEGQSKTQASNDMPAGVPSEAVFLENKKIWVYLDDLKKMTLATTISAELLFFNSQGVPQDFDFFIELYMPEMLHGSRPISIEKTNVGHYHLSNIYFSMRGLWEIRIRQSVNEEWKVLWTIEF